MPVLEDDPYGLVRYEGEPPPSLHELEGGELVTYASSFSKTVAPGVRVGWFVAPAELAGAARGARRLDLHLAALPDAGDGARADRRGAFEPNLERIRGLLKARRDAMLAALERELARRGDWSRPEGGYFLWVDLPATRPSCSSAAEAAGVTFVKGADFFPTGGGERSARLAFSYASPSEIDEGVSTLARARPCALTAAVELREQHAADEAGEQREQDHPDQRGRRLAEDEVDGRLLVVADDERDQIRRRSGSAGRA